MLVQQAVELFYLGIVFGVIAFVVGFYFLSQKPPKNVQSEESKEGEGAAVPRMEKKERQWLYLLIAIVLIGNLFTLSPILLSTSQSVWDQSTPVKTVRIEISNYTYAFPESPVQIPAKQVVEFVLVSHDVTYGFGVFQKDGHMLFQIQVVPLPYENKVRWVFDTPGMYDVRSTEYSGPLHPYMFYQDAIQVTG